MKKPALVLSIRLAMLLISRAALGGDYSPTSPVRPSPGLINEWLRQDDPYLAAWDLGAQVRIRYEIRENGGSVAGPAGGYDFREHGVDNDNSFLLLRVRPRVGYTAEWFSVFVEGRHSSTTGDDRNPNPESDGPIDLHQGYFTIGNH